jgi:MFS family permease
MSDERVKRATAGAAAANGAGAPPELDRGQLILALAGVMLCILVAALDQTIVGTALPRIVAELNGFDRYSWVVTSYLLTATCVIPIAGKLSDQFGRKPILIFGLIVFVLGSALCGRSATMDELIIFRGVQRSPASATSSPRRNADAGRASSRRHSGWPRCLGRAWAAGLLIILAGAGSSTSICR